jgi:hypothetical protein
MQRPSHQADADLSDVFALVSLLEKHPTGIQIRPGVRRYLHVLNRVRRIRQIKWILSTMFFTLTIDKIINQYYPGGFLVQAVISLLILVCIVIAFGCLEIILIHKNDQDKLSQEDLHQLVTFAVDSIRNNLPDESKQYPVFTVPSTKTTESDKLLVRANSSIQEELKVLSPSNVTVSALSSVPPASLVPVDTMKPRAQFAHLHNHALHQH